MLTLYEFVEKQQWQQLLQRPVINNTALESNVAGILNEVKEQGDEALKRFSMLFDKVDIQALRVEDREIEEGVAKVSHTLKEAIGKAKDNIEAFHRTQLHEEPVVETMPGIRCWRKVIPIDKVGLYIPGGTAPLFSTILMLGVPAKLAGCKDIILCSPPDKQGKLDPAILYTAKLVGVTQIFKVGGAQAIAAMAYGTETIPRVYKIFGPGNQYVTGAKQMVQKDGVAIDMPAGPSEVAVLADDSAKPGFVAADLLSQAEHGSDSQSILVTTSKQLADQVIQEVERQIEVLPRKDIAKQALQHSKIFVVHDISEAIGLINEYAPEHLIISCDDDETVAGRIVNAGSVFLGNYAPESVGDYASGTNHTLPTNGYAKAYSGVSIDSFVKKVTFQKLTKEGLQGIGPTVEAMAQAEGLDAHKQAVTIRLHQQ